MLAKGRCLVPLVLAVALLWAPSAAFAAISGRIVENVGIKTAKLGLHDSVDAHRLGWSYERVIDDDYQSAGYRVYCYFFGVKSSTSHKYPLEMYSKSNHHVFTFIINTPKLVTSNGTHVGSTEAALVARYGTRVKSSVGPVYTVYYMGTRNGRTDFYVRAGKVHDIRIARY
jgi:hypothetical protein